MQERTTQLGVTGPKVFPIALGCMGMSGMYGNGSEEEGIAAIQMAVDRGVTLIDTGDFYGMGANERLVGKALRGRRDKVQISVKFGALRGPAGDWLGMTARPAAVKAFCAWSLERLGVDVIDVYRPARVDPAVPIEETIGAIADLVKDGYVRHIGLSEVGAETLRRARTVAPIVDLQIEYSLASRKPEKTLFPVLQEIGASATLYGILSRGLLSGSKPNGTGDFRTALPRFSGANAARNERVVAKLRAFAEKRGQTPAQVCIAWALAKQPHLVPVIGMRTRAHVESALAALEKPLSEEEVRAVERIVPRDAIAGDRYGAAHMANLDSER